MIRVLNRLGKKPFSFQMIFWMALGPFFLVAALSALLFQFTENSAVSLVAMVGLVLCWTLRLRGFCIAAALMASCLAVQPPEDFFGGLCFVLPIMSALFLTALCVQEARAIMERRDVQIRNLIRIKSGLEQEKQKESAQTMRLVDENQVLRSQLDESKKWTASLKRLMNVGQQETEQARLLRQELTREQNKQQKRIKELEHQLFAVNQEKHTLEKRPSKNTDPELLAKLNDVRVRSFQLELLSQQYRDQLKTLKPKLQLLARLKADNLQLEHREEKQIEKACALLHKEHAEHIKQLTKEYETRIESLQKQEEQPALPETKAEKLYKQLRMQFDAKDATLHEVRKELHKVHGELSVAQMIQKEAEHLPCEELRVLYRHAQGLREEVKQLEKENAALLALVRDREDFTAASCDQ